MTDRKHQHRNRTLPTIGIVWLVAAIFGDEVVGVILFGLDSDALLMSLTKRWWWIYQGVLAAICLVVFAVTSIWSSRHSVGKTNRSN